MSQQEAVDGILASMNEAMLDDDRWLPTAALIDDACRAKGNILTIAEGRTQGDIEIYSVRLCLRGERRVDLERNYFKHYFPRDERVPRLRRLPEGQVAYVPDLYTDEELRTSPAYNEALPRGHFQNGLNVRMDGPNGSRITWSAADPIDGDGWSASQLEMVRHLLPHLRQYVRIRQALAEASALGDTLSRLLDKTGTAIIQLGRGAQIVAANDRAPQPAAAGRRSVRQRRLSVCPLAGRECRSSALVVACTTALGRSGNQRLDDGAALLRIAAARAACQSREPKG